MDNRYTIEKKIVKTPFALRMENTYPNLKNSAFREVNDEKMIIDRTNFQLVNFIFGLALIAGFIFFIHALHKQAYKDLEEAKAVANFTIRLKGMDKRLSEKRWYVKVLEEEGEERLKGILIRSYLKPYDITMAAIFILFPGLFLVFFSFPKKKVFIFDRKNGLVTFPRPFGIGTYTQPFDEVHFVGSRTGFMPQENFHLAILHPNGLTRSIVGPDLLSDYISMIVWYMDKNRPLPPGTAFDPYREKDYLRRRKEKYPKPLYPNDSHVNTSIYEIDYVPKNKKNSK